MPTPHLARSLALTLALASSTLPAFGCASRSPAVPPATTQANVASTEPARLVVAVVLDQLGSETLARVEPLLKDGAFAHARDHGRVLDRVVYGYASTLTAPGHAAIFSGASPSVSGVVANNVIDRATGRRRATIDDGTHAVLGVPGEFASPSVLRVPTVADALEATTSSAAKTVSLSVKDRSAVLPAGQRPDLVLFYDPSVGFTTSSFYAPALPAWVTAFAQRHPIAADSVRWELPDADRLIALLGPDDGPGEGALEGLTTSFPHVLAGHPRAADLWPYTPDCTEYLFELAYEAAVQHQLGADEVPDLLMISVSGTDYTGHVFGPDSLEYADHLRRADRALLRLYQRLAERTSVAVLVTSDHGVARLPERVHESIPTAARIDGKAIVSSVEAALDAHAGAGDWVLGYLEPYLYLSQAAADRPDAAALRALAAQTAGARPSVLAAFDGRDPSAASHANGDLVRQVRASLDPERSGDVLVIPAFGAIPDGPYTPGRGTTHGSPWAYDTHVPVLMWGAGVSHGRNTEPLEQARVASTLAALLGIAPPKAATLPPLPGVAAR